MKTMIKNINLKKAISKSSLNKPSFTYLLNLNKKEEEFNQDKEIKEIIMPEEGTEIKLDFEDEEDDNNSRFIFANNFKSVIQKKYKSKINKDRIFKKFSMKNNILSIEEKKEKLRNSEIKVQQQLEIFRKESMQRIKNKKYTNSNSIDDIEDKEDEIYSKEDYGAYLRQLESFENVSLINNEVFLLFDKSELLTYNDKSNTKEYLNQRILYDMNELKEMTNNSVYYEMFDTENLYSKLKFNNVVNVIKEFPNHSKGISILNFLINNLDYFPTYNMIKTIEWEVAEDDLFIISENEETEIAKLSVNFPGYKNLKTLYNILKVKVFFRYNKNNFKGNHLKKLVDFEINLLKSIKNTMTTDDYLLLNRISVIYVFTEFSSEMIKHDFFKNYTNALYNCFVNNKEEWKLGSNEAHNLYLNKFSHLGVPGDLSNNEAVDPSNSNLDFKDIEKTTLEELRIYLFCFLSNFRKLKDHEIFKNIDFIQKIYIIMLSNSNIYLSYSTFLFSIIETSRFLIQNKFFNLEINEKIYVMFFETIEKFSNFNHNDTSELKEAVLNSVKANKERNVNESDDEYEETEEKYEMNKTDSLNDSSQSNLSNKDFYIDLFSYYFNFAILSKSINILKLEETCKYLLHALNSGLGTKYKIHELIIKFYEFDTKLVQNIFSSKQSEFEYALKHLNKLISYSNANKQDKFNLRKNKLNSELIPLYDKIDSNKISSQFLVQEYQSIYSQLLAVSSTYKKYNEVKKDLIFALYRSYTKNDLILEISIHRKSLFCAIALKNLLSINFNIEDINTSIMIKELVDKIVYIIANTRSIESLIKYVDSAESLKMLNAKEIDLLNMKIISILIEKNKLTNTSMLVHNYDKYIFEQNNNNTKNDKVVIKLSGISELESIRINNFGILCFCLGNFILANLDPIILKSSEEFFAKEMIHHFYNYKFKYSNIKSFLVLLDYYTTDVEVSYYDKTPKARKEDFNDVVKKNSLKKMLSLKNGNENNDDEDNVEKNISNVSNFNLRSRSSYLSNHFIIDFLNQLEEFYKYIPNHTSDFFNIVNLNYYISLMKKFNIEQIDRIYIPYIFPKLEMILNESIADLAMGERLLNINNLLLDCKSIRSIIENNLKLVCQILERVKDTDENLFNNVLVRFFKFYSINPSVYDFLEDGSPNPYTQTILRYRYLKDVAKAKKVINEEEFVEKQNIKMKMNNIDEYIFEKEHSLLFYGLDKYNETVPEEHKIKERKKISTKNNEDLENYLEGLARYGLKEQDSSNNQTRNTLYSSSHNNKSLEDQALDNEIIIQSMLDEIDGDNKEIFNSITRKKTSSIQKNKSSNSQDYYVINETQESNDDDDSSFASDVDANKTYKRDTISIINNYMDRKI